MENSEPNTLTIDYDPATSTLVLNASDPTMLNKKLFTTWLRSQQVLDRNEGQVFISLQEEEFHRYYQRLTALSIRLKWTTNTADSSNKLLVDAIESQRRFEHFAQKANHIWQSEYQPEEFADFLAVVQNTIPNRTLYRRQVLSAFHLAFSQNACNFSVPGAGKTTIVLAAYAYLRSLDDSDPKKVNTLLIAGPLSSFKAWEDEFESAFGRRPNSVRLSGDSNPSDRRDFLRGIALGSRNVEMVLCSYQTIASTSADFETFLTSHSRSVMWILDEAHYIKRSDGVWASAVLSLAKLANARVVLTGTPAPNGYEDLENLYKFIYPERDIIKFPAASLRAMSSGEMKHAIPRLKESIRPFYTRIRKTDLDLPPVNEFLVDVEMGEKHREIYRSLERKIVPALRSYVDEASAPVRLRARLVRLRQAATNPELLLRPLESEALFNIESDFDFSSSEIEVAHLISHFEASTSLTKLSILDEIVRKVLLEQGKILIWSYFLWNLELLKGRYKSRADFVSVLSGATPVADEDVESLLDTKTREQIINDFHSTEGTAILIANPQAVGESISLHRACRSAVYFDRDFNAGRFIQSKDRIHRYLPAKQEPVSYYYLQSSTTVEEDIHNRLAMKEARLQQLVDSDEIPLFTDLYGQGKEDILRILESYESRTER